MSDWALKSDDASLQKNEFPVDATLTVGREDGCDIVIARKEVSRKHAEIEVKGEVLSVKDLGSVNGTFINGERIEQGEARPGDEIRFDVVVFKVEGPVVDNDKTVVRPAISMPDTDSDATQVNPAISMPQDTAPPVNEARTQVQEPVTPPPSPPPTEPAKPDIDLSEGKTQIQPPVEAPIEKPQVAPEKVVPVPAEPASNENAAEKTGVWKQTEETESGTLVMGAIEEPVAVEEPPGTTASIESIKYMLTGTKAPVQGKTFQLAQPKYIIGRTNNNDIAIDESSVSSRHAELVNENGVWHVNDLGSLNGVYINGDKVNKGKLQSGDKLWIGRVEFEFSVEGASPAVNKPGPSTSPVDALGKKSNSTVIAIAAGVVALAVIFAAFILKDDAGSPTTAGQQGSQPATASITETTASASNLWKQQLSSSSIPSTPALGDVDGDSALDVVVVDNKGWLRGYSGSNGKLFLEKKVSGRLWAAPALHDLTGDGASEIAIASDKGDVFVFNGKGQQLWVTEQNLGLGGVFNRPAMVDVNGDDVVDVVVPSRDKGLVALDGNRGWEIWNTASITNGMVVSSPLIADINDDGKKDAVVVTESGQLLAIGFAGKRASKLWSQQVANVLYASPTLAGGVIIVATEKNGVIGLDARTGNQLWQNKLSGSFFASPIAANVDGNDGTDIIVAGMSGDVTALNAADGKQIWQQPLGVAVQSTPVIFGENNVENLLVLDAKGQMHILNSSNGSVIKTVQVSGADTFVASAVLGDIDNNASLDMVAVSQNAQLFGLSLNQDTKKGAATWSMFLGNDAHGVN